VEALVVPPIRILLAPKFPGRREFPNPHAPAIAAGGGVGQAVVFLRGIDPEQSRPWHHPRPTVEMVDHQFRVKQWPGRQRVGVVQRGQDVEFVSRQPVFHFVSADGAACFGLAFPEPRSPLRRRFNHGGLVELSSGAGWFWMRAHLFVADHPYFVCTDADGRFQLDQVPPGDYEVVAWLPSWLESDRHLNPETAETTRLYFRPPVEVRRPVTVLPEQVLLVDLEFSTDLFESAR
jgi:hypothetical protein